MRPPDRPDAHVRLIEWDDDSAPHGHYLLDCPHGLHTSAVVWVWLDDARRWQRAIVQDRNHRFEHTLFLRVAE
jgi:hypothetical protein